METNSKLDAFTQEHLAAYVAAVCWDDEAECFTAWVENLSEEDLEYYFTAGWSAALANYRRECES